MGDFFELVRKRYALMDNGDRKANKNPTGHCIDCRKPVDRDLGFYRCFDCAFKKKWKPRVTNPRFGHQRAKDPDA